MRVQNSIKNIYMSMLSQFIILALAFISRKVFLDNLGTEYLGINGLLTSLLSMLSLVEGGIGASIVYNLYKPLADNDVPKIIALVKLYKRIYSILAIAILILSSIMYIFLENFIKGGANIPYIGVVYYIFVVKNVVSYLNAHKWSLINADQKGYVLVKYNLIFSVLTTIAKIIVIQITKSYILFLLIEVIIFLVQNIYNGNIVNDRYPYIKTKQKYKVDKDTKDSLITNVKAMFLHNVGGYCVFGTDNLLISTLIGIKEVGLYSNYTMIIKQLESLLNSVLVGIGASIGNMIATETKSKNYEIFKVIYMINFFIYSFATIFLYNLLEPFINWWLGDGLLLDKLTFVVVLINFYITGMRSIILSFKSKAGIFQEDRYMPIIEAIINLATSLILVKYFGLAGIFMGTTISSLAIPVWIQSKLVYNKVFDKSVHEYFKMYIAYIILALLTGIITTVACNTLVIGTGFISLIAKGILCVIIVSMIYIVIFYNTNEFKYILNISKPILLRLKYKLVKN